MRKTPKPAPPAKTPSWVLDSPTTTYELIAQQQRINPSGETRLDVAQAVELSLAEFEDFKRQIAVKRGLIAA